MIVRLLSLSLCVSLAALTTRGAVAAPDAVAPEGQPLASDGFIRDWLVLEPSVYQPAWPPGLEVLDGKQIANEASPRVKAGDAATVLGTKLSWKVYTSPRPAIDLSEAIGAAGDAATLMAFVVAYVVSDAAVPAARLSVGTKDMATTTWNGRAVIRWDRHRAFGPDQQTAIVPVKKGVNVLAVKTMNGHGTPWAVAVRLTDEAGKPITGLKTVRDAAGKELGTAPDDAGYLRDVLVLGPARYTHKALAAGQLDFPHLSDEKRIHPVLGRKEWLNGHGVVWRAHHAEQPFVDFNEIAKQHKDVVGAEQLASHDGVLINGVTWAATYVDSDAERRDVTLEMGVNDHGKVLVNGKEAAREAETGGIDRPRKKARITLKKGRNLITLKSLNAAARWQGMVGLFDAKGQPLTGVKVSLVPETPRFE